MTFLRLHMGTGHPPYALRPGGEISLLGLIKLRVLTTQQQSLRIILLEAFTHTEQAGRVTKATNLNLP